MKGLFVVAAASAGAQQAAWSDWPNFLGPDRNGASPETGLLHSWPEDGPKLLWKVPVHTGFGTPSVSKGEVFLLGRVSRWAGQDFGRCVQCLDAYTGKVLWEFKYATRKNKDEAKKMQPSWGYCPRSTATVADAYVYTLDELGEMYCLDRATGKEVWYVDLDAQFKPSHDDWKGWCASPLLVDGRIILPTGSPNASDPPNKRAGSFAAFDAATGKPAWTCVEPAGKWGGGTTISGATPQPVSVGGESCVLATACGRLLAIRAKDGTVVARSECTRFGDLIANLRIFGDEVLVTASGDPVKLVRVDFAKPPFEGSLLWPATDPRDVNGAPLPGTPTGGYSTWVRQKGHVWGTGLIGVGAKLGDSTLYCLDLASGKTTWKHPLLSNTHGVSVMLADGMLFVRAGQEVMLLEADPTEFKLKSSFKLTGNIGYSGWVSPVLSGGRLYVRGEDDLFCYAAVEKPSAREEIGR